MSNVRAMPILLANYAVAALVVAAGFMAQAATCRAGENDAWQIVSASSVHSAEYRAEFALDGRSDTRWASAGFTQGNAQWLTIDLGRRAHVNEIRIAWERAYAKAYEIRASGDGRKWETVHTQASGQGGRETITGLDADCRFLRVHCTEPASFGLVSIWEIELPDPEPSAAVAEYRRNVLERRRAAEREARQRFVQELADAGVDEIVFAVRQPGKDGHWYANFGYYADDEDRLTYGDGGKLCCLNLHTGEVRTLVDDPAGGVRDPVVHYGAGKILFSYRPGGTRYYHLYEIDSDGGDLRQLTGGPYDDIEPSYLPDGTIVFVSSRCNRWVNCWLTQVGVMYRCEADGGDIRPISSNIEHDNTPWPLPDGRILYQRWEYIDRSQVDYHHLWTSRPDGSQQRVFFGNMHPGTLMIDAKPIPGSGRVVSIFSPGHGRREHDGDITLVDPRLGPDDPAAARKITSATNFRDPWAFSEDLFLAAQGTRLVFVDGEGDVVELYRLSEEDVGLGLACHEPRPLAPRPRERVLAPLSDPGETKGRFFLADVYEGRQMAAVPRGTVKKLLVMESLPKPINFTGGMDPLTYGGSFTLERVLGTVPVEPDGSAYFEAPALRPVFFVALDDNDMAVKRMRSFTTVQPGETVGCVGCHEQRTTTPGNLGVPLAMQRPPRDIEAIDDCPDVFDFPRDIQPILDEHCTACHGYERNANGGPYAGKLILTGDHGPMFSHAYFTMTVEQLFSDNRNRPQSNDEPYALGSAASPIFHYLDGSHYGVRASTGQQKMIRLWIDAGAPYPGTYAALGTGSLGGYLENQLVETDFDWPTTQAAVEVMKRRCDGCHTGNNILPHSLADERGVSFWRFDIGDPRLRLSRHIVFNLSRPEKSLLLLAPLSRQAGGWQLCRDEAGNRLAVLDSKEDSDYLALAAMVEAGRRRLAEIKRFDMPGFQPRREYLREMQRYGILPAEFDPQTPVDPYGLDRRYWESLWYRPPAGIRGNQPRVRQ